MGKSTIWLSLIAIVVSFIAGFMLANTINRGELTMLRSENDRLKTQPVKGQASNQEPTLSTEEIKAKIAEADANPEKFDFQRNLGGALYRYGALKQDVGLITEANRLLLRAHQLNSSDFDVVLALAHSFFDMGHYNKQNDKFVKAREYYTKALALKPGDVEVQTEIAMTYFLLDPPDYERAIPEFQRSLQINPKHVKTLQFLGESYARTNKVTEAENTLATLRDVDPQNPMISQIQALITQGSAK
jgi:tetratricopeptide (TPR) repeat protein